MTKCSHTCVDSDVDVTRSSLTIAARRAAYEYARTGCLELALDEWPATEETFDDEKKEAKAATVTSSTEEKKAAPKRGGFLDYGNDDDDDEPKEDDDPMAAFDFGGPPKKKPVAKVAATPASVASPSVAVPTKPSVDQLHNLPVVARRSFQNQILASLLARRSLFNNELPGNPGITLSLISQLLFHVSHA
jgi:hypothetical protein